MKKFLTVWLPVVAVLVLVSTWVVGEGSRRKASLQQAARLETWAHEIETRFFLGYREELEWLALQEPVRSDLASGPAVPSGRTTALLAQAAGLLGLEAVWVTSAQGRVLASSHGSFLGIDLSSREDFRQGMSGRPSFSLTPGPGLQTPGITASFPVVAQGRVVGLVSFLTSLDRLERYLNRTPSVFLLGSGDRILASALASPRRPPAWDWESPSRVRIEGQPYHVSRRPLGPVPGGLLVSLEAESWPWGAWALTIVILVLVAVTVALGWHQLRLLGLRKAELHDRHQREVLLSHLLEGIAVIDAGGNLRWTNPAFDRLVQAGPGHPVPPLADLWDRPGDGPWTEVLSGAKPWVVFEGVLKGARGGWTPVLAGFTSAEGRFLLSVLDRTEHHRSDQLLRQTQKLTVLGQLSGGVAHDLNNMLGVLMGMADLVKMTLDDRDPLQESVDLMLVTLTRAASLAERMLSFARQTPLVRVPLDAAALLRELRFLCRTALPETVEATVEEPAGPVILLGDENLLLSALLNLILNAAEAMPEGGTVRVAGRRLDDGRLEITVEDPGTGMDAETLRRIFEPFFSTKRTRGGTGLGLSLVQRTIHEHRGTIDVTSRLGEGTRVTIFLPIQPPGPTGP